MLSGPGGGTWPMWPPYLAKLLSKHNSVWRFQKSVNRRALVHTIVRRSLTIKRQTIATLVWVSKWNPELLCSLAPLLQTLWILNLDSSKAQIHLLHHCLHCGETFQPMWVAQHCAQCISNVLEDSRDLINVSKWIPIKIVFVDLLHFDANSNHPLCIHKKGEKGWWEIWYKCLKGV